MAFTIDPGSALLFLIVVALLSVVVFGIMLLTIKRYKAIQNQLDSVLNTTRENLNGARVIRAFCGEDVYKRQPRRRARCPRKRKIKPREKYPLRLRRCRRLHGRYGKRR